MKSLFRLLLVLLPCIILLANEPSLIEFTLEDQFGHIHHTSHYAGKVIVMIAADKGGSTYNEEWADAIGKAMAEHIDSGSLQFMPVADLAIVPSFVRGLVMKMLPSDPESMVLLDWEGLFTEAYMLKPDATNILVFNTHTQLVLQEQGRELDNQKLDLILRTLGSLFATKTTP